MLFKKLTDKDGDEIFVNLSLVTAMLRAGNRTMLAVSGSESLIVMESPKEILDKPPGI